MSNAIREITLEQGEDPREMTLVAFGGGGPFLACLLADDLAVKQVVIPNHAGNFSAWGLLGSDIVRSRARTVFRRLDGNAVQQSGPLLREIFLEIGEGDIAHRGSHNLANEAAFEIRYEGQAHSVPVKVAYADGRVGENVEDIRRRFEQQYRKLYGVNIDQPEQIVAVRATQITTLPIMKGSSARPQGDLKPQAKKMDAYSFHLGRTVPFTLLDRQQLGSDDRLLGPAIIQELTATTYVDANYRVEVHPSGNIFLIRQEN